MANPLTSFRCTLRHDKNVKWDSDINNILLFQKFFSKLLLLKLDNPPTRWVSYLVTCVVWISRLKINRMEFFFFVWKRKERWLKVFEVWVRQSWHCDNFEIFPLRRSPSSSSWEIPLDKIDDELMNSSFATPLGSQLRYQWTISFSTYLLRRTKGLRKDTNFVHH